MVQSKFDYIGTGWSFPPVFDNKQGQVEMVNDTDDVNQSLWILLNTAKGERVMLPGYGCDLRAWLFEPMSSNNQTIIKDIVESAIRLYEPRITVNSIDLLIAQLQDGVLQISINYTLVTTNSRFNIVFPFYEGEATNMATLGISM